MENNETSSFNGGFAFTKKNIGKFFFTPVGGLPTKQAGLIKVIGENYLHAAEAILDSAPANVAGPIIYDMVGSYGKATSFITNGWAGNA